MEHGVPTLARSASSRHFGASGTLGTFRQNCDFLFDANVLLYCSVFDIEGKARNYSLRILLLLFGCCPAKEGLEPRFVV